MRKLMGGAMALAGIAFACTPCTGFGQCGAGETCLIADACAKICSPDGGTTCPRGQTCQIAEVYCPEPKCEAVAWVCQ